MIPPLRAGRVHEVGGAAAWAFAAVQAAKSRGTVLWVREAWQADVPNPLGLGAFFDPARFLLAQSRNQIDSLAVAEEALRDGAVPLVILGITQPLGLTEGRRLQLAARDGRAVGLCLIPEGMGSNAAETRWLAAPLLDQGADSTLMRWQLIKNKSGTLGSWDVRWDAAAHRLDVVSPPGERPQPAGPPG